MLMGTEHRFSPALELRWLGEIELAFLSEDASMEQRRFTLFTSNSRLSARAELASSSEDGDSAEK